MKQIFVYWLCLDKQRLAKQANTCWYFDSCFFLPSLFPPRCLPQCWPHKTHIRIRCVFTVAASYAGGGRPNGCSSGFSSVGDQHHGDSNGDDICWWWWRHLLTMVMTFADDGDDICWWRRQRCWRRRWRCWWRRQHWTMATTLLMTATMFADDGDNVADNSNNVALRDVGTATKMSWMATRTMHAGCGHDDNNNNTGPSPSLGDVGTATKTMNSPPLFEGCGHGDNTWMWARLNGDKGIAGLWDNACWVWGQRRWHWPLPLFEMGCGDGDEDDKCPRFFRPPRRPHRTCIHMQCMSMVTTLYTGGGWPNGCSARGRFYSDNDDTASPL